ncbi:MAG: hypothetical protein ACR2MA_12325 [Egibacteraceae bacterium]
MTARHLLRFMVLVMGVAAWAITLEAPAHAHGGGTSATNWLSRVTDAPDLDGVAWRVEGGDERLEVRNTSSRPLIVRGYDGEPYLRVGPDGVWGNARSPATYLNTDRLAAVDVPARADAEAQPVWQKLSSEPVWIWHDHRVHWMAPEPPPQVTEADGKRVTVLDWSVPFRYAGEDRAVRGQLDWVPAPPFWPWVVAAVVLLTPIGALGLRSRPRADRWPGLAERPAWLLAGVATLGLLVPASRLLASADPWAALIGPVLPAVLLAVLGLMGARRALRSDYAGFVALGLGSAMVLAGVGLLQVPDVLRSQIPAVLPFTVVRILVACAIAQALPVLIAAVLGTRLLQPAAEV